MKTCIKCGTMFDGRRCKPCTKARRGVYLAENKERISTVRLSYRKNNKAKISAADAVYYLINKHKLLPRLVVSAAKYKKENPDKVKATNAAWAAANPDTIRINNLNRSARKRAAGGKLSKGLPEILFKLQKGKCACCRENLNGKYHLDHIMPLVLGGDNKDSNIQLLHARCNLQKGAKHPVDFMQSRGFLF